MQCDKRQPFLTPAEIIRSIANALNTKQSNKTIDEMVSRKDADYRVVNQLLDELIREPIARNLGDNVAEVFFLTVQKVIKDYLAVVSHISLEGVPRKQSVPVLLEHLFPKYLADFLLLFHKTFGGPNPVALFDSNDRTVQIVLSWIAENEGGWSQFVRPFSRRGHDGLTQEQVDRFSVWESGEDLPSLQYIGFLQEWSKGPWPENINWPRVRALLLVARGVDWIRRQDLGGLLIDATRNALLSPESKGEFRAKAEEVREKNHPRFHEIFPMVGEIQHGLKRTSMKRFGDKEKLMKVIRNAQNVLGRIDEFASSDCWFDWHEGRWNVFSGNLMQARVCYEKAFEGHLFRSGANQKEVIEESLVVAASLDRPDKVFLKRLKNMLVTLNYDIHSVPQDKQVMTYKASDFVEDWEIDLWKAHFKLVFPEKGHFPEVKPPVTASRRGPVVNSDFDWIKPDYRHPNRRIKVDGLRQKTYPQLVWFCELEKEDVVSKLLDRGADVNVFSDANDTPILMALRALDIFDVPYQSLDDSFFNLLIKYDHRKATLNTPTSKKRLLPIISAIHSGRPHVVEKILEMGADPNQRGKTDNQSPLYVCLNLISITKRPEDAWKKINAMGFTPEILDSVRRHSAGFAGFTLEDQKALLAQNQRHPLFPVIMEASGRLFVERIKAEVSVEDLREIAKYLLECGADPNAEHFCSVPGYTPLMLAAELDEAEVFEAMLQHGGDLQKRYVNPRDGRKVACEDIAKYFESKNVCKVLGAFEEGVF